MFEKKIPAWFMFAICLSIVVSVLVMANTVHAQSYLWEEYMTDPPTPTREEWYNLTSLMRSKGQGGANYRVHSRAQFAALGGKWQEVMEVFRTSGAPWTGTGVASNNQWFLTGEVQPNGQIHYYLVTLNSYHSYASDRAAYIHTPNNFLIRWRSATMRIIPVTTYGIEPEVRRVFETASEGGPYTIHSGYYGEPWRSFLVCRMSLVNASSTDFDPLPELYDTATLPDSGGWPYADYPGPLTDTTIWPDSTPRQWEYFRAFGANSVPSHNDVHFFFKNHYPARPDDDLLGQYRAGYYVIRETPEGRYEVDLIGVSYYGDIPEDVTPYHDVSLRWKPQYLWGLIGGYYQLYIEFPPGVSSVNVSYTGPGQVYRMNHSPGEGWISLYKIDRHDKVVGFGYIYPEDQITTPEVPDIIVPPDTMPPGYDPDWQYPSERSAIEQMLYDLFVPSTDPADLPLVTMGGEFLAPAVALLDGFSGLTDFPVLDEMPEGITLWGVDFFGPMNTFFSREVDVPLIDRPVSLYGLSRLFSGVSLTALMVQQTLAVVFALFRGGEE